MNGGTRGWKRLSPPFTPSKFFDLSDPFASAAPLSSLASVTQHSRCSMKCSTGTAPLLKWKLRSPHSVDGCMTPQVLVRFDLRPFSKRIKDLFLTPQPLLSNLVLILPFPNLNELVLAL